MSAKTNAEVVIDGKVYTLSGYENEEYLQKVAAYINNKIAEFDDMDEYKHLPGNMKSRTLRQEVSFWHLILRMIISRQRHLSKSLRVI